MKILSRFIASEEQNVVANSPILFSNSTSTSNCVALTADGRILLKTPGTYLVYTNFDVSTTTTGNITVSLLENGIVSPGATGTATIDTADNIVNIGFNAITSVKTNGTTGEYATLTFTTNSDATITNANVIIEKVA